MNLYRYARRYGLRVALRSLVVGFRQWMLEDQANEGLGGPPNNWRHSPCYPSRQHGMSSGCEWWQLWFDNDAFDVHIHSKWSDSNEVSLRLTMAAEDFRKLALWYLWRWAWGEWFGLRRKLFYWHLRRGRGVYEQWNRALHRQSDGNDSPV